MRTPPAPWRCDCSKRKRKFLSESDVKIVGFVASVGAWMAGGGMLGSAAASIATPIALRVAGLSK